MFAGLTSCDQYNPWIGGGGGVDLPQADFIYTVNVQSNQAEVFLTNTSIGATSYEWSFPDGTPNSSEEENPAPVIYTQNGIYDITLFVSDGTENDEITKSIFISDIDNGGGTGTLSAAFGINLIVQQSEAIVTVNNQSTGATSYEWSFPGGTPESSQEENPSAITYTQNGTYSITLEVSDGTDIETVTNTVIISGISTNGGGGNDCVEGGGSIGSTTISGLGNFTGVHLLSNFEVNITEGATNTVTVTGYENLFDYLNFETNNNVVELKFENGCYENVNLVG